MKQNLKNGTAAQGYDVVSFFNGNPKKGHQNFYSNYDGGKFLFSSKSNKETFESSPESYVPQYGGYCSIAMSENKTMNPNPKSWEIRDEKLYFFTRMFFGIIDVKKQWLKNPIELRILADNAWAKMNVE